MKLLHSVQVAEILGVSPKTVQKLVRKGSLNCVQITPKIRKFSLEHVEEFINSHPNKAFAPHPGEGAPVSDSAIHIKREPKEPPVKFTQDDLKSIRKEMRKW